MLNKNNLTLVQALRRFKQAYEQLDAAWVENTETDLNYVEAIRFYPFGKSFDELKVAYWIDETLKELDATVSATTTFKNPQCASCTNEYDCRNDSRIHCVDMYVPFNREYIIQYLVEVDKGMTHAEFEHILRKGIDGFEQLTDVELLAKYNSK